MATIFEALELEDVPLPPLSPSSLFPPTSPAIPPYPPDPPAWRRRQSAASDVLATPTQTPGIPPLGPAARKRSVSYYPNPNGSHSHSHSHSRSHSHSHSHSQSLAHHSLARTHSHPHQHYNYYDHDHIPLERGGSTEGRRRSSVFSLGEPAVADVREEREAEALVDLPVTPAASTVGTVHSTPIPIPGSAGRARDHIDEHSDDHNHIHERGYSRARVHAPQHTHAHSHLHQHSHQSVGAPAPAPARSSVQASAPAPVLEPAAIPDVAPFAPPSAYGTLPGAGATTGGGAGATASSGSGLGSGSGSHPGSGSSTPRSLGAAVRRRIDRSKAFYLKMMDEDSSSAGSAGSSTSATPGPAPSAATWPVPSTTPLATDHGIPTGRPHASKQRLKSLIKSARRHRSQSLTLSSHMTSMTMSPMSRSPATSTLSTPPLANSPSNSSTPPPGDPLSASHSRDLPVRVSTREYPAMLLPSPLSRSVGAGGVGVGIGFNPRSPFPLSPLSSLDLYSPPRRTQVRSMSLPHHPPFNVVLTSAGLQPVGSDELVWGTLSYRAPARTDHLSSRLPRELKVKVFKALLDSYAARPGPGRWDGVNGGWRELVRLSCVSQEWRSLCFDGQLWSSADFTPFAGVMHPGTLRQILLHARPCIKDLSIRGLDSITGWSLTVRQLEAPPSSLPPTLFSALTTLDLFGCRDLTPKDVADLVSVSPNLKRLSLKGLRLALAHVLSVIPRYVTALEELDISRCWSLEFLDVEQFIGASNPAQKLALTSLRMAGLSSTTGGHVLRCIAAELPNLSTLDLLNCKWLGAIDVKDYVSALPDDGPSPLTHLVISGCTNLTTDALELLVGKLPHMTHFEAANLEPVFYLDPPPTLARLVGTMPRLVRLDLDSTGRYGGVCDRLLDELIPGAVPHSPLAESNLAEVRIGGAKNVTAQGILRLIAALPRLHKLEVDGTEADNAVVRAFLARPAASRAISLVDCHRVTHDIFSVVSGRTRARAGWDDYRGTVFAYTPAEMEAAKPVLKTFWAWRAVRPPKLWREARSVGEAGNREIADRQVIVKGAWWRSDEVDEMERGACVIM